MSKTNTKHTPYMVYRNQKLKHFYAPQLVPAGTAEACISYGNSVCLSVCPSRPGTDSMPGEIETPGLHHISLVSYEVTWCRWVRRFPSNEGIKEGSPPLEIVILPLLAHLAWKRLQIDTDLLLIITSTTYELSRGTNIDDLERPWTPKIEVLSDFFCYFRLQRTLRVNFRWNILEIDQDNLRTKLSWCCGASHEH